MKLNAEHKQTTTLTHEPTGITVTFKRLGHTQRTKLLANSNGGMGGVFVELAQQGVGVLKWEGVETPDGNAAPYSVRALDAVVHQEPAFGPWFNDELLKANGFDLSGGDDESADAIEGKSEAPSNS